MIPERGESTGGGAAAAIDAAAKDSETLHVRVALTRAASGFSLDLAFDVPPGITVLFGPSGSGKSTTLAAIAGLVRPDAGRVALGSRAWFDASAGVDLPVHERRVAYVFQSLALFPHKTATDNVTYGMDRRLSREARRERARALLGRFHVSHVGDRKPATFSGGEAQRVALARALGMSPRVILLDEPFSALDAALRAALFEDVLGIAKDLAVPVLMVTHEKAEAAALADRTVRLETGRRRPDDSRQREQS
ncbi:MAG TPA: ATP-binding cassette domain-containing protein [Polyangiaceae bacterium]|jgi:molybdate transport system ATP-binding protein|nr:ATP-binding cassette domain-containing protein [Polyangiaceae bacterium]